MSDLSVAIAFSHKDIYPARWWSKWVNIIGGLKDVTLYVSITDVAKDTKDKHHLVILEYLRKAFGTVHVFDMIDPGIGYPGGANAMFVKTMREASKGTQLGILWMEADLIPLKMGWFQRIEQEYKKRAKPFLGPMIAGNHMNGTGVYPRNWEELVPAYAQAPNRTPFDCYAGARVLPMLHNTRMIQHHGNTKKYFTDGSDMSHIWPEAVLYHPCKTVSLIRVLNTSRFGGILKDSDEMFSVNKRYFLCESKNHPLIFKSTLEPKSTRRIPNWGVLESKTVDDEATILTIMREAAIQEISESDYYKLL